MRDVGLDVLQGMQVVVEEKVDGANCAMSFDDRGELHLQSRGHYLTGGPAERQFDLFKQWSATHHDALWEMLGSHYICFGEWLYAKHTIFYDALPHYFLEFDVLDRRTGEFLSTASRRRMFDDSIVKSVPVLYKGILDPPIRLTALVAKSLYKSPSWENVLRQLAELRGLDASRVQAETDSSDAAEGLYIKVETDEHVVGRYKWVRQSFLTTVLDSGSHWMDRPLIPNQLAPNVDIFAQ